MIKASKKMAQKGTLKLSWKKRVITDSTRAGAMYCFKSCEANQN
ncbi:hypothetical protein ACOHYD_13375 [Desulfobacterota bacterium M19]